MQVVTVGSAIAGHAVGLGKKHLGRYIADRTYNGSDGYFTEIFQHGFKYRLALVVNGRCVLRYDNEAGKGDHRHVGENEIPYVFTTSQALLDDFWNDVDNWRP